MSAGICTTVSLNAVQAVRASLFGGVNLTSLLKETDYYIELTARFCIKIFNSYLIIYRETMTTLIDKCESRGCEGNATDSISCAVIHWGIRISKILQSFWLGYSQRCQYYIEKLMKMDSLGGFARIMITFYAALNSFRGLRNRNGIGSRYARMKSTIKDAIALMRSAAENCHLNFGNKLYLLEAELCSFDSNNQEAQASYVASITCAKSSGLGEWML